MKNLPLDWFDAVSSWTRRAKPANALKVERSRSNGIIEVLEARIAPAGLVYRSDVEAGVGAFEVYNTDTGTWTSLGTIDTGASLAVSASGDLFMLNGTSNMIQKYAPASNTWTDVRTGPVGAALSYGNLEITNTGEFTYHSYNTSQLFYSTPTGWQSVPLPGSTGGIGDYDPATNSVLVGQRDVTGVWKVDLTSLQVSDLTTTDVNLGELRRFGEYFQGKWYTHGANGPIYEVDLSDVASAPQALGTPGGGSWWGASAVDETAGLFYINSHGPVASGAFQSWNPTTNAFTPLSAAPNSISGHTSLAFVPAAPSLSASLDAFGNLTIADTDGTGKANTLNVSIIGTDLVITDSTEAFAAAPLTGTLSSDGKTLTIPLSSVTGTLTFNTGGGNDTLTLDLSTGDVISNGGLVYNGGASGLLGDELVILGGNQGNVTYNYNTPGAPGTGFGGSIVMQNFGTVTYTGLEPITNTGTATNITFNLPVLPAGQFNTASLTDDGVANTLSRLAGATFEQTDFASPTGSITIKRGNANDAFQVVSATDLKSTLIVGDSVDRFRDIAFAGELTLDANQTVAVFAAANIGLAIDASLVTTGTGDIVLNGVSGTNGTNISLSAGALLSSGDAIQIMGRNFATGGDIAVGSTLTVDISDTGSIPGIISGAGGLTKGGTGILTLSGANTYGGATSINDGVIEIRHASALGASGSAANGTTVATNAALHLRGGITVTGEQLSIFGGGIGTSNDTGALRNLSGDNTWNGPIKANNTGQHARIISDSGTLRITGNVETTHASGALFVIGGAGNGVIDGNIFGPGSLTKSSMGGGTWTLAGANTYTGGTTVSAGTLLITGSTSSSSPFDVGNGTPTATLGGTGTIGGSVTIHGKGTLAPGVNGTGKLTTGSLQFLSGSTLAAQINGTANGAFDQIESTGTVTISGGAILSLSGTHVPVLGNNFPLITTATGQVNGTFSGVPNGSTVLFQTKPLQANYITGPAGSFQLAFDQTPILSGTAGDDQFQAFEDGSGNIVVTLGGTTIMSAPLASLTSLTVNGGAGDDTLTLNYNGTGGFFALPVTFNGGTQGVNGDELVITNTTSAITTVTHTFTNANDGAVNIDGTVITYTGLEPITDNLSATNRVFTFSGSNDAITLVDAGSGTMTIDSNFAESVTFANPTTSIRINAGAGTDSVSINSMSAAYTGSLRIEGDANSDSVSFGAGPFGLSGLTITSETVNALPTLNIGTGGLQITTSSTITQSGAISVVGATTLNSGSSAITLSNAGNDFQGSVTATGGAITLRDGNALTLASINGSGNVLITANGSLTVGTVASAGSSVTLTSTTGAIIDGNTAGTLNVSGAFLELNANTGISLDTSISSLDVENQTSGNVSIRELDALNITQLLMNGATGDVSVTNATNDADITTSGLIDGSTNGTILLRSLGQLILGDAVLAGSGSITLEANRNVHIGGAVTTTGAVLIDSDWNNSDSGAITSAVGSLVSGNALTLRSAQGIDLNTAVASINFDNSLSANVAIRESTGASVRGTNSGDDVVITSAAGDLLIEAISAPGSTVAIRAEAGSILGGLVDPYNISALAAALVAPNGAAGTAANPIKTNIDRLEGIVGPQGMVVDEADALQIGGITIPAGILVPSINGINSGDFADVRINSGTLTITERISTYGNVYLDADGTITETGSGQIRANLLDTSSTGSQILTGDNRVLQFDAEVTGAAISNVALTNNSDAALLTGDLNILRISNPTGGNVTVQNTGAATITGAVTSGMNGTPLGGDISISSTGLLTLAASGSVNSRGGSGGSLTLANNVTVDGTVIVGFGDVALNGGAGDLNINTPITVETDLFLNATGNINIRAKVETALTTNNLTLVADTDLDSNGGIRVFPQGELKAGQNLTLTGANYIGTGEIDSIIIDADPTNAAQLGAFGNIRLLNGPAAPIGAATHLAGYVNAITTGNVTFEHAVQLTADTARVATRGAGNILFNGTLDGPFDLRLSTDEGVITFDDRVGTGLVPVGDVRIDSALDVTIASAFDAQSLTILNAPGTVAIAGPVSTYASGNNFVVNANTLNIGGAVSAGAGNIVWSVDNLDIGATVAGAGTLTIQPLSANRSIGLNGTGDLNLTPTELGYLADGFAGIQIGALAQSSAITVGAVTFNDPVSIVSPASGGSINVLGTITGTGNASVSLQAPLITLNVAAPALAIDTAGGDVTLTGGVVLTADTTIETNGAGTAGTFTQNGTINGPFGLTVVAGGGVINLNGTNSTGGPGIGNTQPLTSATFIGDVVNVRSQVVTTGTQSYVAPDINLISGALRTTGTGSIVFAGDVDLSPLVSVTTNGGAIIFGGTVESTGAAGALRLSAGSGSIVFTGAVGTPLQPLASLTILSAGNAVFAGPVNANGAISIAADEIDFNGGIGSVRGSGSIELKPASTNVPTHVGGEPGDQLGILDLTRTDLQALANGFTSITIGRDLGEAGLTIVAGQGVVFQDPVIFEQSGRAGAITVLGSVTGIDNASIDFRTKLIQFTGAAPVAITTVNQPVTFDGVVNFGGPAAVSINTLGIPNGPGGGAVLFKAAVTDTTVAGTDLIIEAGDEDITFARTIGSRSGSTLGDIDLLSKGTIQLNGAIYAKSIGVNDGVPAAGRLEILAKSINTSSSDGQIYNTDIQLNSSVRFNTIYAPVDPADPILVRITGDVNSKPGKTYSLSVNAGAGDVLFEGKIGDTNSLGNVRVKTKGGDATFQDDIFSKGVTISASTISVDDVTTSVTQSYKGAAEFNGRLTSTKLKINSTIDINSADDWNISGRTVLKAKGLNINLLHEHQFGDIDVSTAANAVIHERNNDMSLRTANVTGTLTLVSDGNITDGVRLRVGTLVAQSLTGSIVLDGVNRIASLGAVSAEAGITILSGGTTLTLTNVISTETGNVIIVGNDRSSNNVIVNGGSIDLGTGGGLFRIYTYDPTIGNLQSLSATPITVEALGNKYPYLPPALGNYIIGSRIIA